MKNAGADSNLMTNGCRGRHAVHGLSVETEWLNLLVSHCFSMIMMPYGGPEVQLVDPEHLSPFGHLKVSHGNNYWNTKKLWIPELIFSAEGKLKHL